MVRNLIGTFIYADDCPYIDDEQLAPNIYHNVFAFRLTSLFYTQSNEEMYRTPNLGTRSVDAVRSNFISTNPGESQAIPYDELAFPWRLDSVSPMVSEILCGYSRYDLQKIPIGLLFQSRFNEGFVLKRIKQVQHKNRTKLEVIFSLTFGPQIEVLYSMKFSILAHQQPFGLSYFVPEKAIKIEINVLAHHAFALLFINIHSFNLINPQKGVNGIIYESLVELHKLLQSVTDCDKDLLVL